MLRQGAFGSLRDPQTLLMYWTEMEKLHYPNASDAREFMEQRLRQQTEAQALQEDGDAGRQEWDAERVRRDVERRAQEDAFRDAVRERNGPTA